MFALDHFPGGFDYASRDYIFRVSSIFYQQFKDFCGAPTERVHTADEQDAGLVELKLRLGCQKPLFGKGPLKFPSAQSVEHMLEL